MLLALPDPHKNTYLEPNAWRCAIAIRLGLQLFSREEHCPVCARRSNDIVPLLDNEGYHALTCSYEDGNTRRHNSLRNFFHYRVFQSLGVTVLSEEPSQRDPEALYPPQTRRNRAQHNQWA